MMVTPEPAPSARFPLIVMACTIWEEMFGSGVRTGTMPADFVAYFAAPRGSMNIPMICCCRIVAMILPVAAAIITVSAVSYRSSRFSVHSSPFTVGGCNRAGSQTVNCER
jgi:hypothetical protein